MEILRLRLFSFTIDMLTIIVLKKIIFWNYFSTLKFFFPFNHQIHQRATELYPFVSLSLFICLFFGYFVFSQFVLEGKSFGNYLFNIKIVDENKSVPTIRQCLLRTLGSFLCYISGMFLFLIPFLNKNRKGLQDFMSFTQVESDQKKEEDFYYLNESFEVQDWKESA